MRSKYPCFKVRALGLPQSGHFHWAVASFLHLDRSSSRGNPSSTLCCVDECESLTLLTKIYTFVAVDLRHKGAIVEAEVGLIFIDIIRSLHHWKEVDIK